MTLRRKIFVFASTVVILLGMAPLINAQDPALNRDRSPSPKRFGTAADYQKGRAWLENNGWIVSSDSLIDNVFHLAVGVGYPVGGTTSFSISARNGLLFGITF